MSDRERILKLLEEKKITAEEAARLLDALGPEKTSGRAKFLKIKVTERGTDRAKVNVTLPVGVIRWGLKFVPESAQVRLNEHNIDFDEILKAMETDFHGKLIDIEDDEDQQHVEVYLE